MSNGLVRVLVLSVVVGGLSSCVMPRRTHENLQATLWVQNGAEFRGLTRQCYELAKLRLDEALSDSNWTASIEQQGDFRNLKPAVILDIDETVVDNSPYQAQLVRNNMVHEPAFWNQWVRRSSAALVPGAKDFIQYARSKAVQVFFVTNRGSQAKKSTERNLEKFGISLEVGEDRVLTKNAERGWGSDKRSRREFVGRDHRILLLIGDDLNDFISVSTATLDERNRLAKEHVMNWGKKWIVLPNPLYGSWERSMYRHQRDLRDEQKLRIKYRHLRGFQEIMP